ncbi:MAG: cobyrinate a,c-diamide synthase [Deltaproteobacteria bacterium]|nr:cobyrinate a,c-diamide synthase [Deltaproteobacteria bacterium]
MEKISLKSRRNGIAIGGIRGSSGKTFVSIGIIKSLMRRGISVAPFKKGPDYIDPAWLAIAAGNQCYNLDTFLMDEVTIIENFQKMNLRADFAIVEGNRGIFDDYDVAGTHSFSELIKLLNIPLILVLDCTKSSRTIAAVVHGCKTFDEDLPLKGVILNQLGGERHKKLVTDAIEKYCDIPVLGAIPRISSLIIIERHLGLMPISEHNDPKQLTNAIGDVIENNVDIDAVIKISASHSNKKKEIFNDAINNIKNKFPNFIKKSKQIYHPINNRIDDKINGNRIQPVIGIVKDAAFNFYYDDNIMELKRYGTKIIEINSINDKTIPEIDALYIGGGFPETHAEMISGNNTFRQELKNLIDDGLPVYAECGGLVYLSKSIIMDRNYPMVGIFPFDFEVSKKPVGHGYTIFVVDKKNPYYPQGSVVKGHEFRYSKIISNAAVKDTKTVFKMQRGKGIVKGRDGLIYRNTLATFSHTHAAGNNVLWLKSLVELAVERNRGNEKA